MVNRKSWEEFKASGLLWFTNSILHAFGWSIVVDVDIETGEIVDAYPARVKFRGFAEENNTDGYKKISKFMEENATQLRKESEE